MRQHYTIKCNKNAKQYIGINLDWNYVNQTCILSMDGYVEQALCELKHPTPPKPQDSPSYCRTPAYCSGPQFAPINSTPPLDTSGIQYIQRAVGKFLFYARAIDLTMLHALNDIAISASKGTEATMRALKHFLDYAASHPDTKLLYQASDMILRTYSDAAYLVAPKAQSRTGGFQFLTDKPETLIDAPVYVLAKVIKQIMLSAAEAETSTLFTNAQEAIHLCTILTALGWPQPKTTLITDNNTSIGFANGTIKQAKSKSWDMNTNWLKCCEAKEQFQFKWEGGKTNLADYPSKHHPIHHHCYICPIFTYIKGKFPRTLARVYQLLTKLADRQTDLPNNQSL